MKKKSSLGERLLTAFVFIPLIIILIFFDFKFYPLLNLGLAFFSGMACIEMIRFLRKSFSISISDPFAFFLGIYPIFLNYALSFLGKSYYLLEFLLVSLVFFSFFLSLFLINNKDKTIHDLFKKVIAIPILSFYPATLFLYVSRLTFLDNSTLFILLLGFIVFMNDSLAYFFGVSLGKLIPGSLKVSPKKTLIGFLGGILGTVGSFIIFKLFFGLFPNLSNLSAIFISIFMGILVIWGDLLESAFKRRSDIKDSGTLIKGRGGVLDSVDSFFFIAPVYYYFILLFG